MTNSEPDNVPTEPALSAPGIPRWVKFLLILGAALLLFLVLSAVAGGNHGPGRHMGSPDSADVTSPLSQ